MPAPNAVAVPVFSEHERIMPSGEVITVDAGHLHALAQRHREGLPMRARHNGPVVGSYSNLRVAYNRDGSAELLADEHLDPAFRQHRKNYPNRSAEYRPATNSLEAVALLDHETEPFLDLGTIAYQRGELNMSRRYMKLPNAGYQQSPWAAEHTSTGAVYGSHPQDEHGVPLEADGYGRVRYSDRSESFDTAPDHQSGPPREDTKSAEYARGRQRSRYRDANDDPDNDTTGYTPRGEVARRNVSNLRQAQQLDQRQRDEYSQNNLPGFVEQAQILSDGIAALRDILGELCQGSAMNGTLPPDGPWPTNPSELGFDERQEELAAGTDPYGYDRRPSAYDWPGQGPTREESFWRDSSRSNYAAPSVPTYYGYPDDPHGRQRTVPGGLPVPAGQWRDLYQPSSAADRAAALYADYRGS